MQLYDISGSYTQSGDIERFLGELSVDETEIRGQIDDIDQGMVSDPERNDLRNKVVEGEAYPENSAAYFVKRPFQHAINNLERPQSEQINPQEVHVLAETDSPGISGEYSGIWTINRPGELPIDELGTSSFELGWRLDPEAYEEPDRSAEEIIEFLYGGELPEDPEDINTEQEISRGTTEFRLKELEDSSRGGPPIDMITTALDNGVDDDRRVI